MSVVEAKIKKYLQVVGFPYFRLIEFGFSDRKEVITHQLVKGRNCAQNNFLALCIGFL